MFITSLSIQPFSFWWTMTPDGNFSLIAVFLLKMMRGGSFFLVAVQPRTTVKLDFSWPVVRMVMLLFPCTSIVRFMEMSKVSGTSTMLMMLSLLMLCFLSWPRTNCLNMVSWQMLREGCSLPHRKTFSFHESVAPGGVCFEVLYLHRLGHLEGF